VEFIGRRCERHLIADIRAPAASVSTAGSLRISDRSLRLRGSAYGLIDRLVAHHAGTDQLYTDDRGLDLVHLATTAVPWGLKWQKGLRPSPFHQPTRHDFRPLSADA
jgi:hypothetical protein